MRKWVKSCESSFKYAGNRRWRSQRNQLNTASLRWFGLIEIAPFPIKCEILLFPWSTSPIAWITSIPACSCRNEPQSHKNEVGKTVLQTKKVTQLINKVSIRMKILQHQRSSSHLFKSLSVHFSFLQSFLSILLREFSSFFSEDPTTTTQPSTWAHIHNKLDIPQKFASNKHKQDLQVTYLWVINRYTSELGMNWMTQTEIRHWPSFAPMNGTTIVRLNSTVSSNIDKLTHWHLHQYQWF